MNDTNYDFPVALQPIFTYSEDNYNVSIPKEILGRKAVVRTDTNDTLGIVSNNYGLVKHANVIDVFREAARGLDVEEKISLTNNGGNLFYQMLFPKTQREVSKGDIVQMRMIIKNSYNGMNSLQIIFGALRLVCLNGMVVGTKLFGFSYRHTKNIGLFDNDEALDSLQVQKSITKYIEHFGSTTERMTAMTQKAVPVTNDIFDKDVVPLPMYLLDEAKDSFNREHDYSVWGYYNALTFAITHKARKTNPGLDIDYGTRAWKTAQLIMTDNL